MPDPEPDRSDGTMLVRAKALTAFQAKQILAGRFRGLVLGAYRILRPLGE